ncbi:RNA recognition motif protein [Lacunisphaera limnophila]|uniref:RNA recognition motif protein n=1 Tax=Lacunisphaera limnophila TaxID=1838286 RepID=A0A1D8AU85_9BACT|nr:RNA-binding protein [Lacunisphaera limnophila]AOS44453.1 RNA recognition motif protein [Lacunisphaera limnophila]
MSENSKLYVGNLPFASTAQDLEALFGEVGTVSVVEIIFDKFTGRSRGFAFVTMGSGEEAQQAVEKFHGHQIEGRALAVNIARPREERPPGGGGGYGGGGGRGGFGGGGRGGRGGFRGGRGGGGGYRGDRGGGGGYRGDRGGDGGGGYGRE